MDAERSLRLGAVLRRRRRRRHGSRQELARALERDDARGVGATEQARDDVAHGDSQGGGEPSRVRALRGRGHRPAERARLHRDRPAGARAGPAAVERLPRSHGAVRDVRPRVSRGEAGTGGERREREVSRTDALLRRVQGGSDAARRLPARAGRKRDNRRKPELA